MLDIKGKNLVIIDTANENDTFPFITLVKQIDSDPKE